MNKTCSALIPFYNEKERISDVLDQLLKVKNLSEIICIDGASTDGTTDLIRQKYPQIKIIRLEKCSGKTEAVAVGLKKTQADYVFLCDADLQNLKADEIEFAIAAILENDKVDIIIMRRTNYVLTTRLTRGDILYTGERILSKVDLENVLKLKPIGFQLEIAINKYMADHKKNVYWVPSSAISTFKIKKQGFLTGFINDLKMVKTMINYAGLNEFLRQIFFFCHKRYTESNV